MRVPARGVPRPVVAAESIAREPLIVRRFPLLAMLVLALGAFNLSFRLPLESVTEWDESLYALSAVEMVQSDQWVATTFDGRLDYYNSKPPLNIWLLALSFKLFGVSLLSLRLVSVIAAWTTILVLVVWARKAFGAGTSLLAGLVLSTTFGFIHVHSGKSGNPDALMTLLLLLTVVVTWIADRRPAVLAWLGPLLAGVFLLKGMAVLMPLAFVAIVQIWWARQGRDVPWRPLLLASVLCLAPVVWWAVARWRVDQWQFLTLLVTQDFVDVTTRALDGHDGSLLFYANALQRFQYDWLIAGAAAIALNWQGIREMVGAQIRTLWRDDRPIFIIPVWLIVVLGVPTVMRTKLWWYLNPFYPVFALCLGWLLYASLRSVGSAARWRRSTLAAVVVVALVGAEGRLLWHSVQKRNLHESVQELILASSDELNGRVVFATAWTAAERFVVRGIGRATTALAKDVNEFLVASAPDDLLVADAAMTSPDLEVVRTNGRYALYRRR